jgi:hypothetical protein
MANRYDVINFLSKTYYNHDCSYLEIGTEYPQKCFDLIHSKKKTSVDPNKIDPNIKIDYLMTSDQFFDDLENEKTEFTKEFKWDIIFIDGLHLAEQVYRDIQNAVKHCSGFIILHDCAPNNYYNAHSDYEFFQKNRNEWNGSTWKAFYKYRTESNLKTYTIHTDYGLGVIDLKQTGTPIELNNPWFEFGKFKQNMKNDLNLISVEEFANMHKRG